MSRHVAVRVVPEADEDNVEQQDGTLKVYTTAPATDGQANRAVVTLVRNFLSVSGSVRIVAGHKQENKILEVPN